MSHISELHQRLYERIIREFGPPTNVLGKDHQWTLRPTNDGVSIHLLVNGSVSEPALWIFDPHSHNDGVYRTHIQSEQQLEDAIAQVHQRLKAALTYKWPQRDGDEESRGSGFGVRGSG